MKAALVSWFITLIIIVVGRLVVAVWADLNGWRVYCEDYPVWMYLLILGVIVSIIVSVVFTFMFLFSL